MEELEPADQDARGALAFEGIDVRRMHGIDFNGLELEKLSPQVNLVHGPNAAGKTTLAQAMARALWPEVEAEARDHIVARYRLNGDQWVVRRDYGHSEVRRDGREETRPPLPAADLQSRYYLHLHELLRAEDADLAEEVLRQAAGGYDVEAAADELEFEVTTRTQGISEAQAAKGTREEMRSIRLDQEKLEQKQRRLDELRRQLEDARSARKRAGLLEQAKGAAEAREKLREAEAKVDQYPMVLSEMRGDEDERLADLRGQLEEAHEREDEAQEDIDDAKTTLSESPIPEDDEISERQLRALNLRVQRLKQQEKLRDQLERELENARERAKHAWKRIDGAVDAEKARRLESDDLQEVAEWARRAERVRLERKQIELLAGLVDSDDGDRDANQLRDGYQLLARWLRSASPETPETKSMGTARRVLWGVALVLALGGGAAGLLVHSIGWGALALGLAVLAAAELLLKRSAAESTGSADTYRRDYEQLDLHAPESWNADAVADQLETLVNQHAEVALADREQEALRQRRAQAGELDTKENKLQDEREELVDTLGLAPPLKESADEAVLYAFVDAVVEWQKAQREVEAKKSEQKAAQKQIGSTLERINEALAPYGMDELDDADAAEAAVQTLRDEKRAFTTTQKDLQRAKDQKETAQANVQELEEKISDLLEQLDAENDREVEELCEQHDAYEAADDRRREAETELNVKQQNLRDHAQFDEELLDQPPQEINARRQEVQAKADEAEEIQKEINKIETLVHQAMDGRDLEEARADHRRALDDLRRKRRNDERRAIGRGIADFVMEETQANEMPGVFDRARELFAQITKGRYHLDVNPQDNRFEALDTRDERRYALDALSSGTRVQLILAVRMAFVEREEPAGTKLPVIFDEALANSDDRRAEAIIEGITQLATDGRQVFYLSAQADEIGKWKAALSEADVDYRVHALGDSTNGQHVGEGVSIEIPDSTTDLPAPEAATREGLAERMEVPDWHPRNELGRLHLWYLIDDPALLVRLAHSGIERWGPLKTLAEYGDVEAAGMSSDDFERCAALAKAAEAWQAAWLIGRGKPVNRAALEASGAVSENFIEEVAALCEDVNGDAEAIIEGLRQGKVNRFRTSKIEELEEYFRNEGYIDPQDTLSGEQIWTRVLGAVSESITEATVAEEDVRAVLRRLSGE